MMRDRSLLIRSVRENSGICLMAMALLACGLLLLIIASDGPIQQWLPEWLYALPKLFWHITGIFFACAAFFALLLCVLTIRHGYQHYLLESYGITRSAIVTFKEIEEFRLSGSDPDDADARVIRLGHVAYRYGLNGRTIEDRFILNTAEMDLYNKIEIGDQIPLRVLPYKPRKSILHREKLEQQYRWREPPGLRSPIQVALEGE